MIPLENILDLAVHYQASGRDLSQQELYQVREDLDYLAADPRQWLLDGIVKTKKIIFPSLDHVSLRIDESINPEELNNARKPIVYISNHTSNLDSLIIGFQLYTNGFPYPIFAAGDNLFTNFLVRKFLKSGGAFNLNRTPSTEQLSLMGSYLRSNLESEVPVIFFPEGTRSRDGSLKEFKKGLIRLCLEAYFNNQELDNPLIDDILFVPIGVTYTKVPEDQYFIKDEDSKAQNSNLIVDFWRMSRKLKPVYMTIGKPISIKENFDGYTPTKEELATQVAEDFASYLRFKVNIATPRIQEHIIQEAIMTASKEESSQTVSLKNVMQLSYRSMNRLRKYGYNIIPSKETVEETLAKMNLNWIVRIIEGKVHIHKPRWLRFYGNKAKSDKD